MGAIPLVLIAASWPPEGAVWMPAGLLLLPLLLFATLTVVVTAEDVQLSFGIGFVSRRIPLSQIRGWRIVHSPLYHGIGVRFIRGGTLYNVTSGPAVELLLDNDRVVRIGSDEPQRLIDALAAVHRPSAPDYESVTLTVHRPAWKPLLLAAFVIVPIAFVALVIRSGERPPRVTMTHQGMTVTGGMYTADLPWATVRAVSLEPELPRVRRRTNGYGFGETLRGHFRVDGIGAARLFVQRDRPPFVRIDSTDGPVFVNFKGAGETRQLFREIAGARQSRQ